MVKRLFLIGLVVVIAAGGYFFFRNRPFRPPATTATERTATVEAGAIEVWVTGTGEITPAAQTALAFNVPGNMGTVHAAVGDQVQAGDVLLELDPVSLDASLFSAQAELIAARQQLDALYEPRSALELAQARLAVTQAEQSLEEAQRRARNVKTPSITASEEQVSDAQLVYDTAEANLQLATVSPQATALHAAENNLNLALGQLQEAQARYDDCVKISCAERIFIEAQLTAARNSHQSALDAYLTAKLQYDTALANEQAALDDAAEALERANNNLVAVQDGPKALDVALAEGELAVAEAELAGAHERLAELQANPDPDDVAAAEARVQAAQAQVDQVRLVAPFDGTVMAVHYQTGDTIAPGQVAIVLADLIRLHVDTTVDELDIAMVEIGQPVEMTLDALPGVGLVGQVTRIDLAPTSGASTAEYPVRVELDPTGVPVRVGMTAALSVLVAHKESALLAPNWALRFDPDTGEVFVTVRRGGSLARVPITLGLRNETESEAVSGLEAGDVVVVEVTPEPPSGPGFFGGGN